MGASEVVENDFMISLVVMVTGNETECAGHWRFQCRHAHDPVARFEGVFRLELRPAEGDARCLRNPGPSPRGVPGFRQMQCDTPAVGTHRIPIRQPGDEWHSAIILHAEGKAAGLRIGLDLRH